MGFVPGQDYRHIETIGHHVIRNNTIRRCGQGGITGSYCLVASLIEGNLIEDIGSLGEFNGHELAFVKIHYAVDTVIKNNVVRNSARDGIWLDTRAQGARITGNVIYDVSEWGIFPEVNHGPILVDNNIVYGGVNYEDSEAVSYVHNLFIDSYMDFQPVDKRQLVYFKPHTLEPAGRRRTIHRDNRYYNNMFLGLGLNMLPDAPGYKSNYNLFWGPAVKSRWDDRSYDNGSPENGDVVGQARLTSLPNGIKLTLTANSAVFKLPCPLVTRNFIGIDPLTKQGIENHDGSPITVDRDLFGNLRRASHPLVGPFENLSLGKNTIVITAGIPVAGESRPASWFTMRCKAGGTAAPAGDMGNRESLPSPACGRGAGGEGVSEVQSPHPSPLPEGEGTGRPSPLPTGDGTFAANLGNGVKMEFIPIPAGEFMMGDAKGEPSQQPVHKVKITKPFWLGKYEVTQRQWEAVMGNNPSTFRGPQNPVENVSWEDCQAFLSKLNERSARSARSSACPPKPNGNTRAGREHEHLLLRRFAPAARQLRLVRRQLGRHDASGRPEKAQRLGPLRHARQRV